MSMIENERVKLTATALNNTAIATMVTGLIAPAVSYAYGIASPPGRFWWSIAFGWFIGALALHVGARFVLGRLKP